MFEMVQIELNCLMDDLGVETSKKICDSLGESSGVGKDDQAALIGLISCCLFGWWPL